MNKDKANVSFKLEDIPMMIKVMEVLQQENKQLKTRIDNAIVTLNNIYLLDNVTITNNACEEIDKAIKILRGEENDKEDNNKD